jgi:4-hydroxyphenylacetate 3-monooxygenase
VRTAEADARPNEFGVVTPRMEPLNACRNWFPKASQRFPQILRKLGASGLMALPTEADIDGDAREDIERYLQAATLSGPDRVRLFRLVWDLSLSAFAGRQALYEYYFFGDPIRMAGALVRSYDRTEYTDRIRDFLRDDSWPPAPGPSHAHDHVHGSTHSDGSSPVA